MAGKPTTRAYLEDARKRITELEQENTRLRQLLALHAPEALDGDRPEPVKEFSAGLLDRVMAMGAQGMSEPEWISAFGMTESEWVAMKLQHPELADAAERAQQRFHAYWDGQARAAIASNNNRFPMQVYNALRQQKLAGADRDRGDASKLVRLDLRASA